MIRVEDRQYFGVGFGTDEQAGEPIGAWILKPGLYKLIRVGDNYRARRDFVTVRLLPGKHTDFLLVLDAETGEFAGGGEVPSEELFRAHRGFSGSLILGGDVTVNVRTNVLGAAEGVSLAARGFFDGRMSVDLFGSPLIFQLQVEEGLTDTPDGPIQKSIDRVDVDGLYVYRFRPWIGPYARFGAETNVLPGDQSLGGDYIVVQRDRDGDSRRRTAIPVSSVRLSPPFGFSSIREGVGINLRAIKTVWAELNIRMGVGGRHRVTRELFELDPCSPSLEDGRNAGTDACVALLDPELPTLIFREVAGNDQFGGETALLATLRLTRFIVINLEVDALVTIPVRNSIIEAETSIALKLTSFLSVNYVSRYNRDASIAIGSPDRVEQDVLLRFSVGIL